MKLLSDLMELSSDNQGGWIAGMEESGGELLSKSSLYFSVGCEGFGRKGDWLIGRRFGTFLIEGLKGYIV